LGTFVKAMANQMDDVIIQEDSAKIYVKQYKTSITLNNKREFEIKIDSTYHIFKQKQKQILYEGKILEVNEHEEYVKILQDNKNVFIKNIFANKYQYTDIEDNIGKNIIVTQYYYPKERIRYKIK
jgi:hypothetical protein